MPRSHRESLEQRALIRWADTFRLRTPPDFDWPMLGHYLFAIPNGGLRSKTEAAIMKAEGVRAGVHDLLLTIAAKHYRGLWIEMKKPKEHNPATGKVSKAGTMTKEQVSWGIRMRACGYHTVTCYSSEEARTEILRYLR